MGKTEKKVISTQTYTIKVNHHEDGTYHIDRTCDGFNPIELLGVLNFTTFDIMAQITGEFKPDFIKLHRIIDQP